MATEKRAAATNVETSGTGGPAFKGGFPTLQTIREAYDAADSNRAVQAYRFFFPTVSGAAIFKGNAAAGVVENEVFGVLDTQPRHLILTANSDTPYGSVVLDLSRGPMVVELPPGPLMVVTMDVHQRWVADMGLPGPDEGRGGKHLLLPPGYSDETPDGYHVWRSTTRRLLVGVRALPVGGDVKAAVELIKSIRVRPLDSRVACKEPAWVDLTDQPQAYMRLYGPEQSAFDGSWKPGDFHRLQ